MTAPLRRSFPIRTALYSKGCPNNTHSNKTVTPYTPTTILSLPFSHRLLEMDGCRTVQERHPTGLSDSDAEMRDPTQGSENIRSASHPRERRIGSPNYWGPWIQLRSGAMVCVSLSGAYAPRSLPGKEDTPMADQRTGQECMRTLRPVSGKHSVRHRTSQPSRISKSRTGSLHGQEAEARCFVPPQFKMVHLLLPRRSGPTVLSTLTLMLFIPATIAACYMAFSSLFPPQ